MAMGLDWRLPKGMKPEKRAHTMFVALHRIRDFRRFNRGWRTFVINAVHIGRGRYAIRTFVVDQNGGGHTTISQDYIG